MKASPWQHTTPLPQPTRHRMRGRTDFEDSLLSARREDQAQERRRLQALTEALRSRGISSDPSGDLFRAAQERAIQARRAENARLARASRPAIRRPDEYDGFGITQLDSWDDEASGTNRSASSRRGTGARRLVRRLPVVAASLAVAAGACAVALLAYPQILPQLAHLAHRLAGG